MKIYLNSGHDIETAEQMVLAMESSGGVPVVRVTLCSPQSPVKPPAIKWDGVSFLKNIEYTRDGIRIWRAYNVGRKKLMPWSEFNIPKNYVCPKLDTVREANHASHILFNEVKARRSSEPLPDPSPAVESQQSTVDDDSSDLDDESLFFFQEEGCIRSFQRFSSLQRHLDYGSHKYALEQETLYDKAILANAVKLEQGATVKVPKIPSADIHLDKPYKSVLRKGWGLKSTKQRKCLSEKQKKYLLDFYRIGESTGRKAEPASVARSMRKSKNSDGDLLFDASEFLTPQQIANFFFRLSAKRVHPTDDEAEDEVQEDLIEATAEKNLQDLSKEVLDEVSIQHPIMYDTVITSVTTYHNQSWTSFLSLSCKVSVAHFS